MYQPYEKHLAKLAGKTQAQKSVIAQLGGHSEVYLLMTEEDAEIICNLKSWPYHILQQDMMSPAAVSAQCEAMIIADPDGRDHWGLPD